MSPISPASTGMTGFYHNRIISITGGPLGLTITFYPILVYVS